MSLIIMIMLISLRSKWCNFFSHEQDRVGSWYLAFAYISIKQQNIMKWSSSHKDTYHDVHGLRFWVVLLWLGNGPLYPYHLGLFHWYRGNPVIAPWLWSNPEENWYVCHCIDVIMSAMASQITQPFVQAQIKENMKALSHWPLCGESTGDWWILLTRASNAENASIWWRHHDHTHPLETDNVNATNKAQQTHAHFL